MKILVLGGAGYIGSHTVYELIDSGTEVVVVDNLLTGFREAVHPKAKFYEGDIRDRAFMDSVFEKEEIDGVIHFAASSQVGESMTNPLKYYNYLPYYDPPVESQGVVIYPISSTMQVYNWTVYPIHTRQ